MVVKEVPVYVETPAEAPASNIVPGPFAPDTARQQALGITARELEILNLVARGFSNREIAAQLFVSENTVKTHCARAFDKLGASAAPRPSSAARNSASCPDRAPRWDGVFAARNSVVRLRLRLSGFYARRRMLVSLE